MIRPPGRSGVAFTEAGDGDQRGDEDSRRVVSKRLGISESWATLRQVHGDTVCEVAGSGPNGEADAVWTSSPGLPLAVFTADCIGVALHAPKAVGVAHAGWRGVLAGVTASLRSAMTDAGHTPTRAEIGPGIGSCCFEVGDEVSQLFRSVESQTRWGTTSVDLAKALAPQLDGLDVWSNGGCTMHEEGWFSHRREATPSRLATIGWLP